MNITESLSAIAEIYPRAEVNATGDEFDVSSGGLKKHPRDPEPVFCLTKDIAISLWRDEVMKLLSEHKAAGFAVLDGPHIDRWSITVADSKQTHRISEERYSVTARVGVVAAADAPEEPVVELPAAVLKPRAKKQKVAA